MSYVTWEYYSSLYDNPGKEDFERLVKHAEIRLDNATHMRVRRFENGFTEENATDFEKQVHMQIQYTACGLINKMYLFESNGIGEGIVSVSNDGYSESYSIKNAQEKENELMSVIITGLSGTGLAGAI